jgi:ubiquinone/menaquinone biosynthesis C-methylase UbiE
MPYEIATDRRYKAEVWALDSCAPLIEELRAHFPEVNYIIGNCLALPFEKEIMDYIVAGELLEHLEKPEDFIKEVMRVLKPGGYLALSTPYNEGPSQPLIAKEHLWSFDDNDIIELLKSYGEVEITHYKDTTNNIIAFCKKL